jgi:mannosyltransferase
VIGAVALRRTAPLFAPITFLHVALTVVLLLAVGMRIWPRFFFTDIAFVMFLIVMGVRLVCDQLARLTGPGLGRALWPLALVAMALLSAAMAARNYLAPKQDLAGAYGYVQGARQAGERVYDVAYAGDIFDWHFKSDWQTLWTDEEITAALARPGPMTVVVTFPARNFREYPALAAAEASGALTETRFFPGTLGDGGIVILHRD